MYYENIIRCVKRFENLNGDNYGISVKVSVKLWYLFKSGCQGD